MFVSFGLVSARPRPDTEALNEPSLWEALRETVHSAAVRTHKTQDEGCHPVESALVPLKLMLDDVHWEMLIGTSTPP